MNAADTLISIAIVFVAAIAGGLVAIVGIVAEVVQRLRKPSQKENVS